MNEKFHFFAKIRNFDARKNHILIMNLIFYLKSTLNFRKFRRTFYSSRVPSGSMGVKISNADSVGLRLLKIIYFTWASIFQAKWKI